MNLVGITEQIQTLYDQEIRGVQSLLTLTYVLEPIRHVRVLVVAPGQGRQVDRVARQKHRILELRPTGLLVELVDQ